jgi:pimeloyl-ACP methyl ester carboxylesterase
LRDDRATVPWAAVPPTLVDSTNGVRVAVHDLGGPADPDAPILLFSHATGFHGRAWSPMASHLADRFRCLAVDYRGHGMSVTPDDVDFHWQGFGDDCVAVLDSELVPAGATVHGVGHSMGGAALVKAAARRPWALRSLWLYEPILPPPGALLSSDGPNPMAAGAAKRRPDFESFEAAIANYSSKPPLDELQPDALRAYVEGGFALRPDGSVTLRCRPEWEAATFDAARHSGAWGLLPDLHLPVSVVSGKELPFGPASFAPNIAVALSHGHLSIHPELGHFGPLQDPEAMAAELTGWVTQV